MPAKTTPSERFQLLQTARFLAAGGLVFGLDLAGVWIFRWFLPPLPAVTVAYFIAVAAHFWLNRQWVFEDRAGNIRRQGVRYVCLTGVCWLATLFLVDAGLRLFTDDVVVAKALAIPPVTILGFLILRGFVFSSPARSIPSRSGNGE